MQLIDVRVGDSKLTQELFPELNHRTFIEGKITHIGVLENGTSGGDAAIGFNILLPSGHYVFAELTQNNFTNLAHVVKGAVERFAEKKKA